MKKRLRTPSPAFVVSLIALFVALGGTTYAATSLPKNSVGTKQLKKDAVTGAKIKDGAVTAAKINPAGLTVPNASQAGNSSLLGGFPANHFLPATGTAANSDQLGGAAASAYQRRVTGTCNTAVSAVNQDGSVACSSRVVVPIDINLPEGIGSADGLNVGDLAIIVDCENLNANKDITFYNRTTSPSGATFNWLYSDGALNANGVALGIGNGSTVNFYGKRIEGQFIYSVHNREEVTVNLHAIDLSSSCEVTGTAEYAPE